MIEKIRELVKKECDSWDWNYHILPVVKNAKMLAKKLGTDEEIAEIAALLHDIGRIRHGTDNHEITGIAEAEKILRELNYSKEIIEEIKHVVESHRGKGKIPPKTRLAKIIANADAMAHFDTILAMMQKKLQVEGNDLKKACEALDRKVERDYKKLTIKEAKEATEEKYKAIRLLLSSMKEYL